MSIVTTVPQMDGPVDAQVRMTGADSTTEATTETTLPTLSIMMHQELTRQWGRERDQRRREALLEYARRRNSLFQHKAGEMRRLATRSGAGETGFNVKAPVNVDRRRRILATGQRDKTDDELVPCRLEVDYDGYKISDVLLVGEGETGEGLELIAGQLCVDYDLPTSPFAALFARLLREQMEEYGAYRSALAAAGSTTPFVEMGPVMLRLDIIVGVTRLEDRVELSLDPATTTSAVLAQLAASYADLLPPAFRPLILHNLLEQVLMWRKAVLFGCFHRDARTGALRFHDPDLAGLFNDSAAALSIALPTVQRHPAHMSTFTPVVTTLALDDLDRLEASRERESRRRRRTGNVAPPAKGVPAAIPNNLSGSLRSPPRTLPTPTSYRGSQHRITTSRLADTDSPPMAGGNATAGTSESARASVPSGRKRRTRRT